MISARLQSDTLMQMVSLDIAILISRDMADVPLTYWRNVDCRSRKMRGLQSDGTWEAIMLRMRNGKKSIERGRTCYGKPYIRQTNWMQVANIEYKTIEKIINTE